MADRLVAVRGRTLAAQHGLPYVDLARFALNPNAVRAVPLEVLERLNAVPSTWSTTCCTSPSPSRRLPAWPSLERVTGRPVVVSLAAHEDVREILDELVRGGTLDAEQLLVEGELADDAPAVRAVNAILGAAVAAQASDVHVIPVRAHVLHPAPRGRRRPGALDHDAGRRLRRVSRIKVMAGLDVAERRVRRTDGSRSARPPAARST